ncbi:MAG: PQQ-binding-like beta-propeller repeat protein [Firmicutes bacterium]|nr:PQQ-binding-like beta-propeller repeat protein [Bacillota bacterium]
MQNTILDLMTWSKLFRNVSRKTTAIEARDNLVYVSDRLDDISTGLLTGRDSKGKNVNPGEMGQALLRLWRVTNEQTWRFSTVNVLGEEGNQISLILSFLRDSAENLLRGDYISPESPLKKEDIEEMMNPIGLCPYCKKVMEAKAGFCPYCKKRLKADQVLELKEDAVKKVDFIKEAEIDFEKLAPSTVFLFSIKNNRYECHRCGFAPFEQGQTKDPKCRDLKSCSNCGIKEKAAVKGPKAFISDTGLRPSALVMSKEDEQEKKEDQEKIREDNIYRGISKDSAWPCEGVDMTRGGQAKVKGPAKGKVKWSLKLSPDGSTAPVTAPDGSVFVGVPGTGYVKVSPAGKPLWIFHMEDKNMSSACLDQQGHIIFNMPGKTYKLNEDGSPRWMAREGGVFPPALDDKGNIYVISDINLVCISHDGLIKWSVPLGVEIEDLNMDPTPAITSDGNITLATDHLLSFDPTGKLVFKQKLVKKGMRPVTDNRGYVYTGYESCITAYGGKGSRLWFYEMNDQVSTPLTMSQDGLIYFGSMRDGSLYCISNTGSRRWGFRTGYPVLSSPVIDCEENSYFSNQEGKLYCINKTGQQKWVFTAKSMGFIGGGTFGPGAIGMPGTLYITCTDGKLYAIE